MKIGRPRFHVSLLTLLALTFVGCGGSTPQWQVVSQAAPNPLTNVRRYALAPVTFENFTWDGGSEADWLATRNPQQRDGWERDKAALTERMLNRFMIEKRSDETIEMLAGAPAPGVFVLNVNLDAHTPNGFTASLRVRNATGQIVDEIRLPVRGAGGSVLIGLNSFVVGSAVDVLSYLRSRYSPSA